jgi:hypothetical protein
MIKTLDAAAYWKLRARFADAQRCAVAALAAREALTAAQAAQTACLREVGLDPSAASWTLDDDTLTVTVPET